jgi:hypothetical protein
MVRTPVIITSKMIWYGLEPLAKGDQARALKLAAEMNIPLLAQYTARRAWMRVP